MKKNIGKILYMTLAFIIMMMCGCGKSGGDSGLSRAEYIGMLSDGFGYVQSVTEGDIFSDVNSSNALYDRIQACAEWEVINAGDKFEPDGAVTMKFALESAVKAVGIEHIRDCGIAIDENDLMGFFAMNIAQVDTSDPDAAVDDATAQSIVDCAVAYYKTLELPQVYEYALLDGVKTAAPGILLNTDGSTGEMRQGADYEVGDVVYFEATDNAPAEAVKITSIYEDGTFQYIHVGEEEVFESLYVSGTYDAKVLSAVSSTTSTAQGIGINPYYSRINPPASGLIACRCNGYHELIQLGSSVSFGADFEDKDNGEGAGVSVKIGDDGSVTFSGNLKLEAKEEGNPLEESITTTFSVKLSNIKVTPEYKSFFGVPTKVMLNVEYDSKITWGIEGSISYSVPLGEVVLFAAGPITLNASVDLVIGVDGEIKVSVTVHNKGEVGWKAGSGLKRTNNAEVMDASVEAQVTFTIGLKVKLKLRVLGVEILNVSIEGGVAAKAKAEMSLMDATEPDCVDLSVYMPLKITINDAGCLLTKINGKLKLKVTIFDEDNSPLKFHWHFENGELVEECTRGKAVVEDLKDEEGNNLDLWDNPEFVFVPFEFELLVPDRYVYFVNDGETVQIEFTEMPEGVSASDLKYEVEDGNVCTVSNGRITATMPDGSTIIRISTPGDMAGAVISVVVNRNIVVEGFEPL